MARQGYVAFDLGAESGRTMLAILHDEKITLEEINRFPNRILQLPDGLHWDITGLFANLLDGLQKASRQAKADDIELVSLGVDTWGVDFGLIGKSGALLGLPYAYRNPANFEGMKKAVRKISRPRLYAQTGIQLLFFNTLFQMVALKEAEPKLLKQARHMLNAPDLLHYFFTGKAVSEATIASTTQMVDPSTGKWATGLLKELNLPRKMLGKIVPAGTRIGKLRKELAVELGMDRLDVTAVGGHDTASAVAAVPVNSELMQSGEWAYLSSGTWSLMGAELDGPVLTAGARDQGFTNERGVGGKIRFLKNIAGLWLVQEVRRDLARQGHEFDYVELTKLAGEAEPFRTLLDPAHVPFQTPGDMLAKINKFAQSTGQPKPQTPGQTVRACLESLALAYRVTLESLETVLNKKMQVLHIVGGGGKNALLNQMTADAIGRPVIVGPYEATAIGNALTQAIGAKKVRDLTHLRSIVCNSTELTAFTPKDAARYDAQIERYRGLLGK